MPRPIESSGMLWLALFQNPCIWNTATMLGGSLGHLERPHGYVSRQFQLRSELIVRNYWIMNKTTDDSKAPVVQPRTLESRASITTVPYLNS